MRVFKVSFSELVKYQGDKELSSESHQNLNVVADDAEAAIARVRKNYVGKKREMEYGDEIGAPVKLKGAVKDIAVDSVEHITYIDML